MLNPEAQCAIAARRAVGVVGFLLAEQRHEEVFRHGNLVLARADGGDDLIPAVDGSALHNVERIAEAVVVPAAHLCLHVCPHLRIEAVYLRLHVRHVERLRVCPLVERVGTVGRSDDVAVIVAREAIGVGREMILRRQVGIVGVLAELPALVVRLAVGLAATVARMHLVARPALRAQRAFGRPAFWLQVAIPLHAVVHAELRNGMDDDDVI